VFALLCLERQSRTTQEGHVVAPHSGKSNPLYDNFLLSSVCDGRFVRFPIQITTQALGKTGFVERKCIGIPMIGTIFNLYSTCFVAFCSLVQLQLLYNLPTSFPLAELDLALPCSEEEWSAETQDKWWSLKNSEISPPTPSFKSAFRQLFEISSDTQRRYSEFGSFITISGILSGILDGHRAAAMSFAGSVELRKFDTALDNWQRLWLADPKNLSAGPSTPFGAMAFNAAAIYRSASIRRCKDYSMYLFLYAILI
jgi:hypothetical protein